MPKVLPVFTIPTSTIYYIYVHKVDAQRINIKWRVWPPARLAEARLALAEYPLASYLRTCATGWATPGFALHLVSCIMNADSADRSMN